MRFLPWDDGSFERVLSWFTSFGYFDDRENRRVLREARRVLRSGGLFLIENNNLELREWLFEAGFRSVDFVDHAGDPLTAASRRMVTRARA